MRKLRLSTKFPHHEIRWNYGILRSVVWLLARAIDSKYVSSNKNVLEQIEACTAFMKFISSVKTHKAILEYSEVAQDIITTSDTWIILFKKIEQRMRVFCEFILDSGNFHSIFIRGIFVHFFVTLPYFSFSIF